MRKFTKLFSALAISVSLPSLVYAITVDLGAYTGTQAFPVGSTGFCEVSSIGEIVLFSTADNNSLADYFYAGITDSTGTIPRGVTNTGAPSLGRQQGNSLFSGNQAVSAIVLQSDLIGPNGPTPTNPWYWTIWEGTAVDPNAFFNSGTIRGAIVEQIPIADSTWDNPPAGAGPTPCRPASTNAAPIANAGADTAFTAGSTVTLNGTASTDADNDTLTYSWTQLSGPAVTLNNPTAASPNFTAPNNAQTDPIVFQLIVNDGTVDSAPATVSITIGRKPIRQCAAPFKAKAQ